MDATDDYLDAPMPKKLVLPPKRTYVVRRYAPESAYSAVESITIEAHRMINEAAQNAVAFYDYVQTVDGVTVELHRLFFDVLEVEMVMRQLNTTTPTVLN